MKSDKGWDPVAMLAAGWGVGLLAAIAWISYGEVWEVLGDGLHYVAMYNGQLTDPPFAYRVLTPLLARQLPWSMLTSFGVVTICCLTLCTGVLVLFARQAGEQVRTQVLLAFFWLSSFAFIYYATTRVRADAPMLLMMAILMWLAIRRAAPGWLALVLGIGALSHETMLLGLAALWVDRCLSHNICGGQNYGYKTLMSLTAGTGIVLALTHWLTPTIPPTDKSYLDGPGTMLPFALQYSGGLIKHFLRMYAAYGPAVLYAAIWSLAYRDRREWLSLLAILSLALMATFLATDTLRVMAIIYVPILLRASRFVNQSWQKHGATLGMTLVCMQLLHSVLVYGHLRTFKSSHAMNVSAGLLAVITLGLSLYSAKVEQRAEREHSSLNQDSSDFASNAI